MRRWYGVVDYTGVLYVYGLTVDERINIYIYMKGHCTD